MSEQLRSSIVRIHDWNGRVVGAGFLVTDREILTCAHVIAQALGISEETPEKPADEIRLDFPLVARGEMLTARVILWRPVGASPKEEEDVVVLDLERDTPVGAHTVHLVKSDELWGHVFRAFGFPVGYDNGVWASGRLLESDAAGWVQIEDVKDSGFRIQPGFSGAPVWDEQLNGVAGMIVAAEQRPEIKAAFIIPADLLVKTWPALGESPYRGLSAFCEQDAPFFFGREVFTEQLIEAVQKQSLIAVIGPSGSGKSSVVFAGLLPYLRQEVSHLIAHFRPRNTPFFELAEALLPLLEPQMTEIDRLTETNKLVDGLQRGDLSLHQIVNRILQKSQNTEGLLLFVDQFEELYTLCSEPEIRRQFLDEFLSACQDTQSTPSTPHTPAFTIVLTLRADFMEQALAYRPFADALQDNMLNMGPMTREELQEAIERPAEKLHVAFEAGLVERILDDIENEPGSLPLLEFALTLLWERRAIGRLTHEAYEAIGRVKGALARRADEVYAGLNEAEQKQLRQVLVQLVRPGEGTEDTRRLANRKELDEEQWALVRRMADTRLVVTDRDPAGKETVEVVHESLIRGWGQLREWMNEDRSFRTWQERLRAALRQWEANERDDGALLRGAPLAEAEGWLTEREIDLSQVEQQFVQASLALREREQRRELEVARKLAKEAESRQAAEKKARREAEQRVEEQTRATKRLRRLAVGLVLVSLVTVGIALFAIQERNKAREAERIAEQKRDEAENAKEEAKQQARHAHISLGRQLIAQAQAELEGDPRLSLLLAIEALNITSREDEPPIPAAKQMLRQGLLYACGGLVLDDEHIGEIVTAAISFDNDWFFSGSSGGTARLWDLSATDSASPTLFPLRKHEKKFIVTAAFSPDHLFTLSQDGILRLWNLPPSDSIPESIERDITAFDISTDNQWLVTGSRDGTVRLWDLQDDKPVAKSSFSLEPRGSIYAIVISPDSHWLITRSRQSTRYYTILSDLHAANPVSTSKVLPQQGKYPIHAVAIGPDDSPDDNHWIVTGSQDSTVLWNLRDPDPTKDLIVLKGHSFLAISPDNRWLVTVRSKRFFLTDLRTEEPEPDPIELLDFREVPTAIAISIDRHWLITGSKDGTIQLWDIRPGEPQVPPIVLTGHTDTITRIAISPDDNRWLVTGSKDKTARLWNLDLLSSQPSNLNKLIKLACQAAGRNLTPTEWKRYFPGEKYHTSCPDSVAKVKQLARPLTTPAQFWNALCWSGSLRGHAAEVLKACEQAVALEPGNGIMRDSRGLARALTGNIDGAIEDFQAYIHWLENEEKKPQPQFPIKTLQEKKSQRQRWIDTLRMGENPFTPEEIKGLSKQ